jgi:hypothetical protein
VASSIAQLRRELASRNASYARRWGLAHEVSRGAGRIVVYLPSADGALHGNFLPASYAEILANENWRKRLSKVHAQAKKSLPRAEVPPGHPEARKWCELDSSTSSDALLMNIFCYPGLLRERAVQALLNVPAHAELQFGFKARVPRTGTTGDATEIDLRLSSEHGGDLLIEAKLTENNFQRRDPQAVERYRDFAEVFDAELLPRCAAPQRWVHDHDAGMVLAADKLQPSEHKYESYQMIRNVMAAHAHNARLCVLIHACRADLREHYHAVLRAVRPAELRTRCTLLTWQELAAACPASLRQFLGEKYGIRP